MNHKRVCVVLAALAAFLIAAPAAQAQPSVLDYRWSLDVGLGWDNSLSGNINSGAIGNLDGQVAVVTPNSYTDVYGTGFHLRFGGGYLIDEISEVRATFTYQSLSADLTSMGEIGDSTLYGQYRQVQELRPRCGVPALFRQRQELAAVHRGHIRPRLHHGD